MKRILTPLFLLAVCLVLLAACGDEEGDTIINNQGVSPPPSGSLAVVTDNNSIYFVDPSDPGTLIRGMDITGIAQATISFAAIDFRPSTGEFYGLEVGTGNNRLYTIDLTNGFALRVGVNAITATTDQGFDFSPASDILRIVDPTDTNFRVNADTLASSPDTALNPAGQVVALAYTNNTAEAATTTLYGIDTAADTLVRIGGVDGTPSPNGGAITTIGALGVDPATNDVSFDIAPSSGTAYAAWATSALWRLYTIDLTTGAATEVGILGNGGRVLGISVVP
jgi:hypothetical protein